MDRREVGGIVARALAEDLSWGDVTTESLVPHELGAKAAIVAKDHGVLAGIEVVGVVFEQVDAALEFKVLAHDGQDVSPGDVVGTVEGTVSSILKGERVVLNFLQRLSGIASETRRYVQAVEGLPTQILDTRKTTPGLRVLEKYAVKVGGGRNHRMHLGDGILIKDNHLLVHRSVGGGLKEAIAQAKGKASGSVKVEIEVRSVEEALEASEAGADIVMLDNMNIEEMRRAVELLKGRALLEASGGITLDNVRAVAETGVDFISVGAITHSPRALDISLEVEKMAHGG
jgi:nicotinate-nucleotide pyrophosphorylase (carboxylating)